MATSERAYISQSRSNVPNLLGTSNSSVHRHGDAGNVADSKFDHQTRNETPKQGQLLRDEAALSLTTTQPSASNLPLQLTTPTSPVNNQHPGDGDIEATAEDLEEEEISEAEDGRTAAQRRADKRKMKRFRSVILFLLHDVVVLIFLQSNS